MSQHQVCLHQICLVCNTCLHCLQVLYLTEPIDEVAIQNLAEYNDKKFMDVSREGVDLGADEEDTKKVTHLSFSSLRGIL